MRICFLLLLAILCFSFRPTSTKEISNTSNGFYVFVEDHTNRTTQKFLVESKDSVNSIFNAYFNSELELGEVDRPISIFNGKLDFYIARVAIYEQNGKKNFRHLKYPSVYTKRSKLKPVTL